jgi:phosphopantetheinyl transferase
MSITKATQAIIDNSLCTDVAVHYLEKIPRLNAEQFVRAFDCLDEVELVRYHKFTRLSQQTMFLTARLICKTLLSHWLKCRPSEIKFNYSRNGKPSIVGRPNVHFSLTHSGLALAVAISRHNVGVDIEWFESLDKLLESPELYINAYAAERIGQASEKQEKSLIAARYWTALEALVKLNDSSVFKLRSTLRLNDTGPKLASQTFTLEQTQAALKIVNSALAITVVSDVFNSTFRFLEIDFF